MISLAFYLTITGVSALIGNFSKRLAERRGMQGMLWFWIGFFFWPLALAPLMRPKCEEKLEKTTE